MNYKKLAYAALGTTVAVSMAACSAAETSSSVTAEDATATPTVISTSESVTTAESVAPTESAAPDTVTPESQKTEKSEDTADIYRNDPVDVKGDRTAAWVPAGIRLGEHDSYIRLTLDLIDGEGKLGYKIGRDPHPAEMGRGQEIKVNSQGAPLDIFVTGTTIPTTEKHYAAYDSIPMEGKLAGLTYKFDGVFEGLTHIVIGTPNQKGYRVMQLENPKRLVIDIAK